MLDTGIRQLRMARSLIWGRPISADNVRRLVGDALRTLEEFGAPGDDVQLLLDGPYADPELRRSFQTRALRRTAVRAASLSPFYRALFARADVAPERLTLEDLPSLPVTRKQDLLDRAEDFLADGSRPYLSTRTTGTTGRPTEIWLSREESELWPAMAALSGLLRGEIGPDDFMQINISSRATAAVQQNVTVCGLVGARCVVLGLVPPEESLDGLCSGGDAAPTLLSTYPSYLAELVQAARRRGLGADAFRLRRIDCGGELLSASLAAAAAQTLGAVVNDTFAMTEVLPVSGRTCAEGHLHHDLNMGLIEIVDPDTGQPVQPGEIGTVVVTPYYPFRECMPVLRYDTRDLVQRLPDETLHCDLAGTPGTSRILGKADQLLRSDGRPVTPRDLVEVYEALPSQPWPARFEAHEHDGRIRLSVPQSGLGRLTPDALAERFDAVGIAVTVRVVDDDASGRRLRPARADLLETTFASKER
jgi:phenylacetate-coenzyme A ligase PaaK-like adenylate-forming protein